MRTLIALLIAVMPPAFAHAQGPMRSDAEIAGEAEAAFERGVASKSRFLVARQHFSQAADRYLELHRRGVRNAELYRSLGNAALLADRWPEAIWAYQLGLELDPNDAGLRDGLAFARVKVLYPPGGEGRLDPDSWPAWLHRPTRLGLFFAFAGCYALACLAGTCAWLGSRASLFAAMILGLAALAAGAGLWQAERRAAIDRETPIVVVADNGPFYQGNAASYPQHPAVPILPRGIEARRIHARGQWLQIRLSTGEVGWLPRSRVLIVQ